MPERRRIGIWVTAGALGCLGLAAGLAWKFGGTGSGKVPAAGQAAEAHRAGAIGPNAPLAELAAGLKQGDGMALAVLVNRVASPEGTEARPIPESEGAAWQGVVMGIRAGLPKFSAYGRASAVSALARVLDRYTIEPAPADWLGLLAPSHEVFTLALADPDAGVRIAALNEMPALWVWSPGCDFTVELDRLASWKEGLHREVVRVLGDREPAVRAAAVSALAALPIDTEAQPAVAYLEDPSPEVRLAVVSGFAQRRALLDEESLLPRLWDSSAAVTAAAEQALKARGLASDQIGLGKMVVHPQTRMRISAVAMVLARTDLDPVVWLLFLSRDADADVRARAVEALAGRDSAQARDRLSEMAVSDPSPDVRQAAARVAPPVDAETTASLPPLPGSPRLNPRAN